MSVVEHREECYLVTVFSDAGWRSWFVWGDGSRTLAEEVSIDDSPAA